MTRFKQRPKERAILRRRFDALRAKSKPFREHLEAIKEEERKLIEAHQRDVRGRCEDCDRIILAGEQAFSYPDGPITCKACSPTWSDLKADQDALIADGLFEESFDGGPEAARAARSKTLAQIESGNSDKKVTWEH